MFLLLVDLLFLHRYSLANYSVIVVDVNLSSLWILWIYVLVRCEISEGNFLEVGGELLRVKVSGRSKSDYAIFKSLTEVLGRNEELAAGRKTTKTIRSFEKP